jgi:hypothetical protein
MPEENSINPPFFIKGVIRKLKITKKWAYFIIVDFEDRHIFEDTIPSKNGILYVEQKSQIECVLPVNNIYISDTIKEFDKIGAYGTLKFSSTNKIHFTVERIVIYNIEETSFNNQTLKEEKRINYDVLNAKNKENINWLSNNNLFPHSKTVSEAVEFILTLYTRPAKTPTWSRSIPLNKQKPGIKAQIKRILTYFEDFLTLIVGDERRTAEVVLRPQENALILEVVSLDFEPQEIENWYNQYIQFLADPNLIDDLIHGLTSANQTHDQLNNQLKIELVEQIRTAREKLSLRLLDNNPQINFIFGNQVNNMTEINLGRATINNSGVLNLGQIYGEVTNSINHMVKPDDEREDELIQVQEKLQEILELIKTNQEMEALDKQDVASELKTIVDNAHTENNPEKQDLVHKSLRNLNRILAQTAGATGQVSEIFSNLQALATFFGLKL